MKTSKKKPNSHSDFSRLQRVVVGHFVIAIISSCGSLTSTAPDLKIQMLGIFNPPKTATGNVTPLSQSYTIEAINVMKNTGESVKLLTESKIVKIVNRPQIILSAPMTDYKGGTFSRVSVTFNSAVETNTRSNSGLKSTLKTLIQDFDVNFTIDATSEVSGIMNIHWGNIVTKDETSGTETVDDAFFTMKVE